MQDKTKKIFQWEKRKLNTFNIFICYNFLTCNFLKHISRKGKNTRMRIALNIQLVFGIPSTCQRTSKILKFDNQIMKVKSTQNIETLLMIFFLFC